MSQTRKSFTVHFSQFRYWGNYSIQIIKVNQHVYLFFLIIIKCHIIDKLVLNKCSVIDQIKQNVSVQVIAFNYKLKTDAKVYRNYINENLYIIQGTPDTLVDSNSSLYYSNLGDVAGALTKPDKPKSVCQVILYFSFIINLYGFFLVY